MQHIMNLKIKGRGRSFYFIGKKGLAKDVYTSIDLSSLTDVDLKNISKSLATEVIEAKDMSASEAVDIVDSLIDISKPSSGSAINVLDADQLKNITISDIKGLEERLNTKPAVALNAMRLEGKNTAQLVEEISKAAVVAASTGTINLGQVEGLSSALSTKVSASDKGVALGIAGLDGMARLQLQSSRSLESINNITAPGQDFKILAGHGISITNDSWARAVVISSNSNISPASVYNAGPVRLSISPNDAYSPIAVGDNDSRLSDPRSPTGTCLGIDIEGFFPHGLNIKQNSVTDGKLGPRTYRGTPVTLQDALVKIQREIDEIGQTTIVESDPVIHTHHTIGLGNVLNEKQLVASKNLGDLPNKDAAREVIGAASMDELKGTAAQLITKINAVDLKLQKHMDAKLAPTATIIAPGSITSDLLAPEIIDGLKATINTNSEIIFAIEGRVNQLRTIPAATAKSVGLGEVVNAKQLVAHNNLEDLGDLKKAKKVLGIAGMASQERNNVEITGGHIKVATLSVDSATIFGGEIQANTILGTVVASEDGFFIDAKQVVGERQSFEDVKAYKNDGRTDEHIEYLTNKVIELTKILKKHGLIGE